MEHPIEFLSAVIIYSPNAERLAQFYRGVLGIPLEEEQHEGEPLHYGCELGDIHFAIHPAKGEFSLEENERRFKLAFTVFSTAALLERLEAKSHHWQFEDERRIFINLSRATREDTLYFHSFDNDMRLEEVILGPRCGLNLEDVRKVTRATNPCAIVFRSRLEFGGFRVIRNGRDLPSIAKALTERPKECI